MSGAIEQRRQPGPHDHEHAATLTHQMWRSYRKVALVTNADVATQALRLARMFNDAVWNEVDPSVDIWEYMDDAVDPFMAAARRDLDNYQEASRWAPAQPAGSARSAAMTARPAADPCS